MTTNHSPKNAPVQHLYEYDEAFWKERFPSEPYVREGDSFEDYSPAYQYGIGLRAEYNDFDSNEAALADRWEKQRGSSKLDWERAREPVKIAWFQDREFATTMPEEVLQS